MRMPRSSPRIYICRGTSNTGIIKTYRDLYETTMRFLPPPDLVVYLRASVSTLMNRISNRGRDYEQTISPDYLQGLNNLYEHGSTTSRSAPCWRSPPMTWTSSHTPVICA